MLKFPLATSTWNDAELIAMRQVIDSGNFTMGEKVKRYESEFADTFDCKYCVMVNSGSSANLLMIAALMYTKDNSLKLSKGDEVIVPAVSWATTYFPITQHGLRIKFVDIDLKTLNFNLDDLEQAISPKTKAIFCVNLLGNPNDFANILTLCEQHNLILLEDNCEAMGAKYLSKHCGSFGVMGSFSSYFSHHISTMEGGCIITDNEELYHILLSLRSHGWTRQLPALNHVTEIKSDNDFLESFNFVLPGYNLRPLELSAAIGLEQLKKLDEIVEGRRKNAKIFNNLFQDCESIQIQSEIGESSWFGFSLIFKPNGNMARDEAIIRLRNNNVETRPIVAGNFTRNPVIDLLDVVPVNQKYLKNANFLHDNGLFVGNHHYDIEPQLQLLKSVLTS